MIEAAVLKEAGEKAAALHKQADDYMAAALKRAEEEVLRDLYNKIQEEVADIHGASTRSISQQETQARHNLLLKREEITKSVFYQVRLRLQDYTQSSSYARWMLDRAKNLAEHHPLENSTVLLRPVDYHFAVEFDKIFGQKCHIIADENIHIGGFQMMNQGAGIFVDETLDSRLEDLKPWFYSNSGLAIQ
mgnify:CR=1 FL=1